MIYAVYCELEGIMSPGGVVKLDREEVTIYAKSMASIGLDLLDDTVNLVEWYDLNGEETDPYKMLQSDNLDEVENIIVQISDEMKTGNVGCIDLRKYEDIFEFIEDQNVNSWCSKSIKDRIYDLKKEYFSIINDISDEWIND